MPPLFRYFTADIPRKMGTEQVDHQRGNYGCVVSPKSNNKEVIFPRSILVFDIPRGFKLFCHKARKKVKVPSSVHFRGSWVAATAKTHFMPGKDKP